MNDILDQITNEVSITAGNLKRSTNIAKASGVLIGIWLGTSLLRFMIAEKFSFSSVLYVNTVLYWVIVVSLLAFFALSPAGLFFSLRSCWRKEGKIGWRIGLLLFHLLSCLLLSFFVYAVLKVLPF